MKTLRIALAWLIALSVPIVAGADRTERIRATLIGYEEVPSVSTVASGRFRGEIHRDEQSIDYELTFSGLQGTVQQSHIHVAQKSVNGSIVIWLCQTATTPVPPTLPAALALITPVCPQTGTVTGIITAANVISASQAGQQITAGELAEVIAAIRAGVAYVNVHTTPSTGGEIRGQIRASGDRDDKH